MNWESKLRISISAVTAGELGDDWIGFKANPSLHPDEINRLANEVGIKLPEALAALYTIADGMLIGECFRIGGLTNRATEQLSRLNEFLLYVRECCESHGIQLLFGSEGYTGDLLCLTDQQAVVTLEIRNPRTAVLVLSSLDLFFDDVCLGPGYLSYNPTGDRWASVLRRLGFLE